MSRLGYIALIVGVVLIVSLDQAMHPGDANSVVIGIIAIIGIVFLNRWLKRTQQSEEEPSEPKED